MLFCYVQCEQYYQFCCILCLILFNVWFLHIFWAGRGLLHKPLTSDSICCVVWKQIKSYIVHFPLYLVTEHIRIDTLTYENMVLKHCKDIKNALFVQHEASVHIIHCIYLYYLVYQLHFFLYAETLCRHCHFTFIISFINYRYIIIFWGLFFDDRSVTLTNRSWIRQSHGIERSPCCWFINISSRMLVHAYTYTNSYKDKLWCLFLWNSILCLLVIVASMS